MNRKQIVLWVVLLDFVALTAYAVYQQGYMAFYDNIFGSPIGVQLGVDLVLALGLALTWMWNDARERGAAFWPYLLVTCVLGTIGPLVYLIRRESQLAERAESPALARAGA